MINKRKNKTKVDKFTFCKIVDLDIFKCSVVVLVGDIDDPKLKEEYSLATRDSNDPPPFEEIAKILQEAIKRYVGVSVQLESDNYIYIKEWDSGIFIHESHHAIHQILEHKGVKDPSDEVAAYCQEYLFDEIVDTTIADRNFIERNSEVMNGK